MFLKSDLEKAKERKIEEYYFNLVAQELEQNIKHNPTWVKALSKSKGDTEKAKSYYIDYRVQSLKDDTILREEYNKQKEVKKKFEKQEEIENIFEEEKKANLEYLTRKKDEKSKLSPYLLFFFFLVIIIGFKYLLQ